MAILKKPKTCFIAFCFISLLLMLNACASPSERGVKVGMSMKEVETLIGPPTRKSTFVCPPNGRNCPEIWQYDGYNVHFSGGFVNTTQ